MKTALLALVLVVALAAPAGAAEKTTIARLRHKVALLKGEVNRLHARLTAAQITIGDLESSLTTTTQQRDQADAGLATANATVTGLQAALQGSIDQQVSVETPDELWHTIGTIWNVFPNVSACGYSKSAYSGTSLFTREFDLYTC
jgi:hypothetical protein